MKRLSLLFQSLLKFDTRAGSPGIQEAINLIKEYCAQSNLHFQITGPNSGPKSIVIKTKGFKSNDKGLVLLSHLDTADWKLDEWNEHPQSVKNMNGKIYGRGAIDCKSLTAIWLFLMKYINRERLQRDIILVITSDEETGGELGLKWIVENTNFLKGCTCALNEGGGYIMPATGNKMAITCQYGEKGRFTIPPGKTGDSINIILQETGLMNTCKYIVSRLKYTRSLNKFIGCGMIPDFRNSLFNTLENCNDNTEISFLPGVDFDRMMVPQGGQTCFTKSILRKGQILIKASVSSLRTRLFRIILKKTRGMNMMLVPVITKGYSDSRYLRYMGIDTYGFFPIGKREDIKSIHNPDEHIHEKSLYEAFEILYSIVSQYSYRGY